MKKLLSNIRLNFIKIGVFLLLLASINQLSATDYVSAVTNGAWATTTSWSPNGLPGDGDKVTIKAGNTITLSSTQSCASLVVGNGVGTATLIFNSGSQLTVNGTVTLGDNGSSKPGVINMGSGGYLICNAFSLSNSTSTFNAGTGTVQLKSTNSIPNDPIFSVFNNLEIVSGTTTLQRATTFNGNVAISSGAGLAAASGSSIVMKGNFSNSGTFTANSSTVTFNGTGAQSISGATTFNHLTFASSGTVTATGAVTTNGILTISSGTLAIVGNYVFTIKGNWVNNSVFTAGATSTVIFNGTNAQTIGGTSITNFNKLVIANSSGTGVSALGVFNTTGNLDINSSKLNLAAATNSQDLAELHFDGPRQVLGTWGATGSGATNINDIYFGGTGILTVFVGEAPLPVELVYFTARLEKQNVALKWKTAAEVDNKKFIIEHSTSGVNYSPIGEVMGNGTTTTPHTYYFTDISPSFGLNYYRLKQVDNNGAFKYSAVRSVTLKQVGEVLVYPTVTNGTIQVELPEESFEPTTLSVYNLQGALLSEQVLDGNGINFTVTLPEMPSGQYIVEVKSGALSSKTRIFKG